MNQLVEEMSAKALKLGIPLTVHLDLTYRCNERCVHCYLDHEDHGEMTTSEIKNLLDQLAEAGVFFLTLSGGEILMRSESEISVWNPFRSAFTRIGQKCMTQLRRCPAR